MIEAFALALGVFTTNMICVPIILKKSFKEGLATAVLSGIIVFIIKLVMSIIEMHSIGQLIL
jgi:thiamine transporter ThiT